MVEGVKGDKRKLNLVIVSRKKSDTAQLRNTIRLLTKKLKNAKVELVAMENENESDPESESDVSMEDPYVSFLVSFFF